MREIEFRVWDKLNNIMILDSNGFAFMYYVGIDLQGELFEVENHEGGAEVSSLDNYELMQYTGLRLKNNNLEKLFEGDIIRKTGLKSYGVVCWLIDGWKIKVKTPKGDRYYHFSDDDIDEKDRSLLLGYTKYGNVYETPELLEGSNK